MKRLGDTAVSPDGKWLAYSVTTVDLDQNKKTAELFIQAIADTGSGPNEPKKLTVAVPGDSGVQFAPDGRSVLFLSGRENGQQIWLADFDPATGETSNPKKLTAISTEADNALWTPDGRSVVLLLLCIPTARRLVLRTTGWGQVQCRPRQSAGRKQGEGAGVHTPLVPALGFTSLEKSAATFSSLRWRAVDARPDAQRPARCSAVFAGRRRRIRHCAGLEGTGVYREPGRSAGHLNQRSIFTLDLTNPAAKPVKVSTQRAATSTRLTRRMGSGWPGGRRNGRATRAISLGSSFTTARQRRPRT